MTTENPTRTATSPAVGWLTAAAMVGAPLLIGVGNGLHPVAGDDVNSLLDAVASGPALWLFAKLTYAAGCLLLIPAAAGLLRIRSTTPMLIGAILAGVGGASNALSQALNGYLAYAAVEVPGARESGELLVPAMDQLGAAVLPISFFSVPLMVLGLLVVGITLLVSRGVSRVVSIVMIVGLLAAGATSAGPVAFVAFLPLVVAFVMLARTRLRLDRPGSVAETQPIMA